MPDASAIPVTGFPDPATHLSEESRRYFHASFSRAERDALRLPESDDAREWRQRNQQEMQKREPMNASLLARYGADLQSIHLGGVPVSDIRPARGAIAGKALIYIHGGGFVGGAAHDALDSTLPLADETGLRIFSIDYTLVPEADHVIIGEQVLTVLTALYAQGFAATDVGVYGDSAGAAIAAAAMLRARDRRLALPAGLVLWSPWADLSCSGDTHRTLADAEPFYTSGKFLDNVARRYAGKNDLTDPLVSVLFADYVSGYLPTLIQCGTRELLLSDAIRLHRRMLDGGVDAQIEIYDGMWHVFQFKPIDSPEAALARKRTGDFFLRRLGVV